MSVPVMILLGVVLLLLGLIIRLVHLCVRDHQSDHAKCIAHIAAFTGNRAVATTLRELARHADSVEAVGEFARIRNLAFNDSGPSVFSLWLNEKADKIEGIEP